MGEESITGQLLGSLGIDEERAQELIDQVWELAVKHGNPAFLVEEWTTLFNVADTAEEAFFVGHIATLLADSMASIMTPIEWLAESTQVAMKLQAAREEKAMKN